MSLASIFYDRNSLWLAKKNNNDNGKELKLIKSGISLK